MSRVIEAFAQYLDDSGDPIENGWLEFLYSGTNNSQKPTYADSIHNVPNANPVQLDGAGRCPNVFGTGIYKVVLYENNPITNLPGVQVQEFDPVQAEATVNGSGDNFEEWDSTVTYEVSDIVKVGEDYYRSNATANFNNYPPDNEDKWEQIDFVRFWNLNVTYDSDDLSVLDGVIYTSLQDENINNDPPTSSSWWSAIGSGTTLLNWTEDGTVFRPVISGYDLGMVGFYVGDLYMNGAIYAQTTFELFTDSSSVFSVDASQLFTFENIPLVSVASALTIDEQLTHKLYVDEQITIVDDKIILFNVYFNNLASPPGSPILNDLWYVSDNRYLKMHNGATWLDVKSEVFFNDSDDTPTGALSDVWYVSDTGQCKFHNGAEWLAVVGESRRFRDEQTATSGQTSFSTSFEIYNESIYLNGVLLDTSEYTVGSSLIVLDTGAADGDIVSINALAVPPLFTSTDYVLRAGDTMLGDLDLGDNDLNSVNNLEVTSINGGQLAGFRNAIINGGFNVWQRGESITSTSTEYFSDRWLVLKDGDTIVFNKHDTNNAILGENIPSSVLKATVTAGGSTLNEIAQRMESVYTLAGHTATVSLWIYNDSVGQDIGIKLTQRFGPGGSSQVILDQQTEPMLENTWQKVEKTFEVPNLDGKTIGINDSLQLTIEIPANVSYTLYIGNVQVENGPVATPYEVRFQQTEFALCQRYYQRIGGTYNSDIYYRGRLATADVVGYTLMYATKMRAIPVAGKRGTWFVSNCAQPAFQGVGDNSLAIVCSTSSSQYYFHTIDSTTFIDLDAEL